MVHFDDKKTSVSYCSIIEQWHEWNDDDDQAFQKKRTSSFLIFH